MDIIFCEFRLLYQIFFSPQVKQSVIKTNNYGIYELSHELLNDVTAFSPMGGPLCPHKKKTKRLKIFLVLLLK